ncbi:hypothetical protein [Synechococcus sp. BA-132 BA5]|uniref:hypothetical protein n=1 Tax=Synechococcus sp. BA-132 BA5 TaxID=3110252 RepID=UPI002B1FE305|nr:hypothetical protein [Synechococcus sp. BA-132 BA5]MEA5417317.1 hypothetical protein [Synechococcus sp. BA-132 BA5]
MLDPEIKREWIWAGGPFHPRSLLVQRTGAVVERCGDGRSVPLALEVSPHDSLFTDVSDPLEAPEVFQLRRTILSWRFYDSFRTDRLAPARSGRLATRTPSLAAAMQTILEIGDASGLQSAIADAFPRLPPGVGHIPAAVPAAGAPAGSAGTPGAPDRPGAEGTQILVVAHAEALIASLQA